jgi:hypothetical protein
MARRKIGWREKSLAAIGVLLLALLCLVTAAAGITVLVLLVPYTSGYPAASNFMIIAGSFLLVLSLVLGYELYSLTW